ncbi:MAG: hypothetical protein JWR16_714 [Nevskia sp.]|nr:hypothetical protein [Nevskia sp.]
MNITPESNNKLSLTEWLALPEDVMAGIFEEIDELHERGNAEQHWAWAFV